MTFLNPNRTSNDQNTKVCQEYIRTKYGSLKSTLIDNEDYDYINNLIESHSFEPVPYSKAFIMPDCLVCAYFDIEGVLVALELISEILVRTTLKMCLDDYRDDIKQEMIRLSSVVI